ncbi:MAG: DUF2723 domain-containing protein [Akkermansiaceae bacterium]|nr:DUF2723 domain-containing protein [Armatimonadota bacterium]
MILSRPQRADLVPALLVFVLVFGVYAFTACRTIYSGDSGDFLVAIARGGVPHPSGYPLFLIGARVFGSIFAFGEWAFRVNLFVALAGAFAALFVYLFLALLLQDKPVRRPAAAFGALSFAFGTTTWGQATISEVYSLSLAFLAALLFYTLRWVRTPNDETGAADNRLAGLCLLYGLSLTNHLTMAFVFPLFLAVVIWHKPSLLGKNARLLVPLVGLLLLPISLYTYLPLATQYGSSPVRWGTPDNVERFLFHVSGQRYSGYMFPGAAFFAYSAGEYFGTLLGNEFGMSLVFAPVGFFFLIRDVRTRPFGLLIFGIWLLQSVYAMNYATPDISAYYLPTYLALACLMGAGASATVGFLARRWSAATRERSLPLAVMTLCLLPILPFTAHYADADKSNDFRERSYGLNLLRSCPPNAVLLITQDAVFTLWYEQYVRHVRPDVVVVQYSLFTGTDIAYWYGDALRRAYPTAAPLLPAANTPPEGEAGLIRFVEKAINAQRPVLFTPQSLSFPVPRRTQEVTRLRAARTPPKRSRTVPGETDRPGTATFEQWIANRSHALPQGLCVRLYPRFVYGEEIPAPDLREIVAANASAWQSFELDGVFNDSWKEDTDPLHYPMAAQYMLAVTDYGRIAEQAGLTETARECYQKSVTIHPTPEAIAGLQRLPAR